jgi:hypothetical protein
MGMKSDAGHAGWTVRPQQQGSIDLAGEKTTRLRTPLAVLKGLEGFTPVQDQLAMAVRNDALRRSVLSVVFQDPETVEKWLQVVRGTDLKIPNRLGMIARTCGPRRRE